MRIYPLRFKVLKFSLILAVVLFAYGSAHDIAAQGRMSSADASGSDTALALESAAGQNQKVAVPPCVYWVFGSQLDIKVPQEYTAANASTSWREDGFDLGWKGNEVKLDFSPAETGQHNIQANGEGGLPLCATTVYLRYATPPEVHALGEPSNEEQMRELLNESQQKTKKAQDIVGRAASQKMEAQQKLQAIQQQLADLDKQIRQRDQAQAQANLPTPSNDALAVKRAELLNKEAAANRELLDASVQKADADRALEQASLPLAFAPPVAEKPASLPKTVPIDVYYATERAFVRPDAYLDVRDTNKSINYGMTTVFVPTSHRRGDITDPEYWTYSTHDFSGGTPIPLNRDDFYQGLRAALSSHGAQGKQALVFIHGFNNGFTEDLFKTAQLVYDTGFPGQAIMWDWPSQGSFFDYSSDWRMASASIDDLADFLQRVQAQTGASTIHLVAHSMGCHLLLETLDRLARNHALPKIGQIFLAAPDIGQTEFAEIMPHLVNSHQIDGITLYGSRKDLAMIISDAKNIGWKPAGMLPPYNRVTGIDQIDVSALPMNFLGHDYFLTVRPVLDDIGSLLQKPHPMPPARNGLTRKQPGVWAMSIQ